MLALHELVYIILDLLSVCVLGVQASSCRVLLQSARVPYWMWQEASWQWCSLRYSGTSSTHQILLYQADRTIPTFLHTRYCGDCLGDQYEYSLEHD